ncbi:MAG: hypothetical protein ACLFRX_09505 [Gemmatimonadota bacterium]
MARKGGGMRAEFEAFLGALPGPYWVVEENWREPVPAGHERRG